MPPDTQVIWEACTSSTKHMQNFVQEKCFQMQKQSGKPLHITKNFIESSDILQPLPRPQTQSLQNQDTPV